MAGSSSDCPPARRKATLLRARLRLWLTENRADEEDVVDILASASQAFSQAIACDRPSTIALEVEASCIGGNVQLVLHDFAGLHGHTTCLESTLRPVRRKSAAAARIGLAALSAFL